MREAGGPTLHLQIGELIVCEQPAVISTVLGSCVSVCLYSPQTRMGGMIHYAHAQAPLAREEAEDFRYGADAIPALVAEMAAITGARPESFTAKLVGGATQGGGTLRSFGTGEGNVGVARELLNHYRIRIVSEDVGGDFGRRVLFHTGSHRVQISRIKAREESVKAHRVPLPLPSSGEMDMRKVLAIGASTGGTEAIKAVLTALPERIPPTIVVQHIPSTFSKPFADGLNEICPFEVKQAENGDKLRPSRVLIAPGGCQMKLQQGADGWRVLITDDVAVNRHKPSVDYLFHSVAELVGRTAVGVILTGMGADGARGLLAMKQKGARTITQDEASCVVYGMPRAAFEVGASDVVRSLEDIPAEIVRALSRRVG